MYDLIKNVTKIKFGLKILRALVTSTQNHRINNLFQCGWNKDRKRKWGGWSIQQLFCCQNYLLKEQHWQKSSLRPTVETGKNDGK